MTNRPPRILFLSHSASRNGATIVLLHLLRWLKQKVDYPIEVVINGRGELVPEFKAVAPTKIWRSPAFLTAGLPRRWREALRPRLEAQSLRLLLRNRQFDLAYLNTAALWQHLPMVAKSSRSVLWHIHELAYALRLNLGRDGHRQVFPLATRFVAASQSVRDTLVSEFEVPASKVDTVNEFIPLLKISAEERLAKRRRIRQQLGWPENAFVVGGCGALGWRKGTDVFLQIAHYLNQTAGGGEFRFLWVGGGGADRERLEFDHDVQAFGLQERCRCVASNAEVLDYYCAMDVFALTSREDPFPLVMLEAGALDLPVVCFAGSGGGPEFVADGAGLMVPYLDVAGFSTQLQSLRKSPQIRERLGAEASRAVRTRYSIEVQAPKVLQSIEACLAAACG
jgi:glycosyltransferase involved in cell wall biosynthesis